MAKKVDHYGSQYSNFIADLYKEIRTEAFTEDIGQNGWLTADEQDIFLEWLKLDKEGHLLDIACGSGGPSLRIAKKTGCSITGVDIHEDGIKAATTQAQIQGLSEKTEFIVLDGSGKLPFEDGTFDAIMCIDAINHLPERSRVLQEWNRILKTKGKLLFTDPITVTGILSNEEIEIRSSIGYFLFVAEGVNEKLMNEAGFQILLKENRTQNMAETALHWKVAREKKGDDLIKVEGIEAYEGQQAFLEVCSRLAKEGNLSRFAFLSQKK